MHPNSLLTGVGLRPEHFPTILENRPQIQWFEAVTETYMGLGYDLYTDSAPYRMDCVGGGQPLRNLERVREHYPIVLHGVSLNIGSTDPLDRRYLKSWKSLIERIDPLWVSDHFCWTGVDGKNVHDLLPLPYTQEAIDHLVTKIGQVQDYLKRPLMLENVSSYLSYAQSEMEEWEFISEVAKQSGCTLLLDVNNVFVSAVNHDFDPTTYIEAIPPERVGQYHLAGYEDNGDHVIDTHDHEVHEPVWNLFQYTLDTIGPRPTLIEWDDKLPDFETLLNEVKIADTYLEEVTES